MMIQSWLSRTILMMLEFSVMFLKNYKWEIKKNYMDSIGSSHKIVTFISIITPRDIEWVFETFEKIAFQQR